MVNKEYDVVVVGGGPSGSMAARFAAEQGVSVLLLEKDRDIGYPVRCAEAVSKAGIEEFIEPDEKFIATEINKYQLIAPNKDKVNIHFDEIGYVLERRIFDYELAKQASKAGAQVLTKAYVDGLLFENNIVAGVKFNHNGSRHEVKAKVVIGADGVESRVGRWAGIKTHIDFRYMESGIQVTATNLEVDPNTLYFYLGKDVAPEGYFWVFPKGKDIANIGLGISGIIGKKKSAVSYLNDFMKANYPKASILTQIVGGIPCAPTLDKIQTNGLILVGDAARQTNPLSGGGIASGMIGGKIGGRIAGESVNKQDPNHLLTYQAAWMKRLGDRHKIFNRIKDGVFNFSDDQFNKLAATVNKIPKEKLGLGSLFKTALMHNPSLLVDVAKVFVTK